MYLCGNKNSFHIHEAFSSHTRTKKFTYMIWMFHAHETKTWLLLNTLLMPCLYIKVTGFYSNACVLCREHIHQTTLYWKEKLCKSSIFESKKVFLRHRKTDTGLSIKWLMYNCVDNKIVISKVIIESIVFSIITLLITHYYHRIFIDYQFVRYEKWQVTIKKSFLNLCNWKTICEDWSLCITMLDYVIIST